MSTSSPFDWSFTLFWVLCGLAMLVGGWLIWWSVFRDRSKGRRRCPRCWYDMSAVGQQRRCSECGHLAATEHDMLRTRRKWRWAFLGLMLVVAIPGWLGLRFAVQRGWHYACLPKWKTLSDQTVAGVKIELLEVRNPRAADWGRVARLSINGEVQVQIPGFYFEIGSGGNAGAGSKRYGLGDDVTGDGSPDLVVVENSGGSGCSMITYIFEMQGPSRRLRPWGCLPWCGRFEDVDGDGRPEFVVGDPSYAYVWTSGADSPNPEVILRSRLGVFEPAGDLMRKVPPPLPELVANVTKLRQLAGATQPTGPLQWSSDASSSGAGAWIAPMLAAVLDQIYSGNERVGWELLDATWPVPTAEDRVRRNAFITQLEQAIKSSPFAETIQRMNRR